MAFPTKINKTWLANTMSIRALAIWAMALLSCLWELKSRLTSYTLFCKRIRTLLAVIYFTWSTSSPWSCSLTIWTLAFRSIRTKNWWINTLMTLRWIRRLALGTIIDFTLSTLAIWTITSTNRTNTLPIFIQSVRRLTHIALAKINRARCTSNISTRCTAGIYWTLTNRAWTLAIIISKNVRAQTCLTYELRWIWARTAVINFARLTLTIFSFDCSLRANEYTLAFLCKSIRRRTLALMILNSISLSCHKSKICCTYRTFKLPRILALQTIW